MISRSVCLSLAIKAHEGKFCDGFVEVDYDTPMYFLFFLIECFFGFRVKTYWVWAAAGETKGGNPPPSVAPPVPGSHRQQAAGDDCEVLVYTQS